MKNYKECINGHYYQDHLEFCPYCPKPNLNYSGNLDKTVIEYDDVLYKSQSESDLGKTVVESTDIRAESSLKSNQDLSKTYIKTDDIEHTSEGVDKMVVREKRKLVGWLVSYTIDSFGRDFRIFEGKNTLGSSTENDIVLTNDSTVSGHHAIILYRNNQFFLKDNLSTNGTRLNQKDTIPDTAVTFEDNAMIELGDTVFLFRKSF
jgi:hypothetical protein